MALPTIEVLATGGTIAGAGDSATGSAYCSGTVGVKFVGVVPEDESLKLEMLHVDTDDTA